MRINPDLVEQGYIKVQKHPTYELYLYNYSPKTQFEKKWNEDTLVCRGLILDGYPEGRIVARPFRKFFNFEEYEVPPNLENSIAFDKLDGSMGVLYEVDDKKYITTRGSFSSEQAIEGTIILREKWNNVKFLSQYTYLFEIVYPENRIVVNYGDLRTLILLSIIDNQTGKDLSWDYIKEFAKVNNFMIPETTLFIDWFSMKKDTPNREGYVVLCENGNRVKVKFEEYKRLHRIVTGVSTKSIWECLRNRQDIQEYLYNVPDEFSKWATQTRDELYAQYREVCEECQSQLEKIKFAKCTDMKEKAEFIKNHPYKSVIFAMIREKDYESIVWRLCEPKYEQPFKGVIE